MDAKQFITERQRGWRRLETLLQRAEARGFRTLDHAEARQLAALYRQASSDLIETRSQIGSYEIEQYLNDLVGRTYGLIYSRQQVPVTASIWTFFASGFPRLVRKHMPALALSVGLFFAGASFAYVAMIVDPDAADFLVPIQFDDGSHFRDPTARRIAEESKATVMGGGQQAVFTSQLFTHNTSIAFLCFALGIAGGVLTAVLLFYNGIVLGAFAASYVTAGEATFFFAWVLPHGVPEIFSIWLAGAAGLILWKAVLAPGRRSRQESLRIRGREAVLLVLGTIPLLLYAGMIEGTISQIHEPVLDYSLKIALAAIEAACLATYLLTVGRAPTSGSAAVAAGAA